MLIKILVTIFIAFAASRTLLRFRDKLLSFSEFFFWNIIWVSVIVVVFNPGISDSISHTVGIQRGTDAAFFVSIILLFYLVFRLYIKIDSIDRDLTKLSTNISKEMHINKKMTPND